MTVSEWARGGPGTAPRAGGSAGGGNARALSISHGPPAETSPGAARAASGSGRSCRRQSALPPHPIAAVTGKHLPLMRDDNDRACRVMGDLAAHRTHHEPAEAAAATRADHYQVGFMRRIDELLGRKAVHHVHIH
jgi:hypothetical protein